MLGESSIYQLITFEYVVVVFLYGRFTATCQYNAPRADQYIVLHMLDLSIDVLFVIPKAALEPIPAPFGLRAPGAHEEHNQS